MPNPRPTHKVRTRMEPDREIEVGDAELADLTYAGLILADAEQPTRKTPTGRKDA